MPRRDSARHPAAGTAGTVAQRLADGLERRGGPARRRAAGTLRELGAVDRAIYSVIATTPTPSLDEPLRRLSNAANNSGLWLAIAGLGVAGGRAGLRRGPGNRGHRRHVGAGKSGGEVGLVPPAAGPGRRWGPVPAARVDADIHVVPVWSCGVGFRLRRGHRPGSALAGVGPPVPCDGRSVFPGTHRSALPERRRGRRVDQRGHGAGRGRPDGPAAADTKARPIRSRRAA